MAGRKRTPKPPRPALAPDQLDLARWLYLRRGATPKWVADQLSPPCDWHTVQTAAARLGWDVERENLDDARKKLVKPDAAKQVELEVEMDGRHAAQARRVLDLREMIIERAFSDVATMKAADARRALHDLDALKDLQFVERMAAGRNTDKTATEGQSETFVQAMTDIFGPARKPADNRPDAAPAAEVSPVEPPNDPTTG